MLELIQTSGSAQEGMFVVTIDDGVVRREVTVPGKLGMLAQEVADSANMVHNTGPIYWNALRLLVRAYVEGVDSLLKED